MEILHGRCTDHGTIDIALAHPGGITTLEGAPEEVTALAAAMREVAALSGAADGPSGWLHEVPVGADVVRLRLGDGGTPHLQVAALSS